MTSISVMSREAMNHYEFSPFSLERASSFIPVVVLASWLNMNTMIPALSVPSRSQHRFMERIGFVIPTRK
jgi:hypothetical protein